MMKCLACAVPVVLALAFGGAARADFIYATVSGDGGTGTATIRPTLPGSGALDITEDFTNGGGILSVAATINAPAPYGFEETIINNTGYTWTGFTMTVSTFPPDAPIFFQLNDRALSADASPFTSINIDTYSHWAVLSNGSIPNGSSFFIDATVRDLEVGISTLTLDGAPEPSISPVPEPSGLALCGAAAVSLLGYGCWRRRAARPCTPW